MSDRRLPRAADRLSAILSEPPRGLEHQSRHARERGRGGSLVASEPPDDGPGWEEVGPSSPVIADGEGLRTERPDLGT